MHLKSLTLKGFKSFPDRTSLEFGPGVSVIVGPNGSGKSNITDAVLWALGEQSPLAVRGQTMQDVIFAGGHGVKGRSAAEVEVVIDNSDGRLDSEFSEISISRRIDRSGEGVYRLNGARCRLVDVLEVLSDSGLGKEMHSVISQGRVESIVHSKPVDRTALIEEAAGLTKHRKRRHRAQLKLKRTQDNLDRALDVEREARSHLRPLKRQAEAAELHARLERQSLEARASLAHRRPAHRARGAAARHAARPRPRVRRATASRRSWPAWRTPARRPSAVWPSTAASASGWRHAPFRRAPASTGSRCGSSRSSARPTALRARVERSDRALVPLREQMQLEGDAGERPARRAGGRAGAARAASATRASTRSSPASSRERAEAQRRIDELTANGETAARRARAGAERALTEARARRARRDRARGGARARARRRGRARSRRRASARSLRARTAARSRLPRGSTSSPATRRPWPPRSAGCCGRASSTSLSEGARAVAELGAEGGRALVRRGRRADAGRRAARRRAPSGCSTTCVPRPTWRELVERAARRRLDRGPASRTCRRASRGIAVTRDGIAYRARARRGAPASARRGRRAISRPATGWPSSRPSWAASTPSWSRRARACATRPQRAQRAEEQRDAAEARLRDVRREQQQARGRGAPARLARASSAASMRPGPDDTRRAAADGRDRGRAPGRRAARARAPRARARASSRSSARSTRIAPLLPQAEPLVASMRAALAAAESWRERFEQELSADEAAQRERSPPSCASSRAASTTSRRACARPASSHAGRGAGRAGPRPRAARRRRGRRDRAAPRRRRARTGGEPQPLSRRGARGARGAARAARAPARAARPGQPARRARVRGGARARRGARDAAQGPRGRAGRAARR